jgi:mono/diheme cytochrome c family protein
VTGWACALVLAAGSAAGQDGAAAAEERFRAVLKERPEELDPRAWGVGERVPDLAFTDVDGRPGKLSDYAGRKALVIAVRQIGCPVGERYAPRLARLERELAGRGVDFLFVNPDEFLDPEEVRAKELDGSGGPGAHGFQGRYVHDPEQVFGRALGTETTTVCYLLDASRTLRYRGAVDDQYGRGVILPEPRREFLREAIEAVLAGEPVALAATRAPGCLLDIAREPLVKAPEELTYHADIARILQARCVECHHQGGAAPFALETYEQVYNKRNMIQFVVEERIMPPWYAAPETGPWKNDRRLSQEQIGAVLAWIESGAPAGDPADGPMPMVWKSGWMIGEPDLTFAFPAPRQIPAEGTVEWLHVEAAEVVPRDLWVSQLQVLPSDPGVVHHASAEYQPPLPEDRLGRARSLMGTLTPWTRRKTPERADRWQYLFGYLPGETPRIYGGGVARFLPKGSRIRFGMHYTPSGRAAEDVTALGVVLGESQAPYLAETMYMHSKDVDIPPHSTAEFSADMRVPYDVVLYALTPHMHLRGRTFTAEARFPDGTERLLIRIPEWDQDWQNSYLFAEELALPAGTTIHMVGTYDNTAANPNNPDPDQHVVLGQQIWEEMLTMAVEWIRPREEALAHSVRSNPRPALEHPDARRDP